MLIDLLNVYLMVFVFFFGITFFTFGSMRFPLKGVLVSSTIMGLFLPVIHIISTAASVVKDLF